MPRVRFNESDHGRATMVVPANNRRATIIGFNRERRSSVDRALFDILSSDRSPRLTPRLLVVYAFSAPKTRARRLPDNMRRCQDRLGTCKTIPDSLRRFQKVSHSSWTPAGDSKTVCDGAKTIWAAAEEIQTVCNVVRESYGPTRHLQDTHR
ncbi:hypothetical protein DPMN_093746 [Dreissena polymorpha]|uniref:Uncharacterized protein n=1 Tax=Dreissena polymorpha TaxID=45954 RepID=A0A9D4R163_DREPO|nr:hypothetical protein DPMN_093746 [Dreissena polymorpha]